MKSSKDSNWQAHPSRTGVFIGAFGLILSAIPMLTPAFLRLRNVSDE
ncbi:hypothetical protein [Curtobacterium sp. MCPF17_031]|nr:hypothetical protein [Curtobacterium sp. MCPF17_031]